MHCDGQSAAEFHRVPEDWKETDVSIVKPVNPFLV